MALKTTKVSVLLLGFYQWTAPTAVSKNQGAYLTSTGGPIKTTSLVCRMSWASTCSKTGLFGSTDRSGGKPDLTIFRKPNGLKDSLPENSMVIGDKGYAGEDTVSAPNS
jgi:hypothetical protein